MYFGKVDYPKYKTLNII